MSIRPAFRLLCLIILTSVQAAAGTAFGQPGDRPDWEELAATTKFTWKRHITLKRITAGELTGSASTPGNSSSIAMATANGNGLTPTLDLGSISGTVIRTVHSLWQMRVPSPASGDDLDISYDIFGVNGRRGCLSHEDLPESVISVTVHPGVPFVSERGKHWSFIEGDVMLHLDISNAQTAGRYSGTMTITIHQL